MDLNTTQKIFLIVTTILGSLVLLSYVLGLRAGEGADALWGGTPEKIRGVYTASMIVSATAYLIATVFIFMNMNNKELTLPFSLNMNIFIILYAILLVCSAVWIPLINQMVANPSTLIWVLIRASLILVGLSSLAILFLLIKISPRPTGALYWSSVVGMTLFFIHTGILDAFLWPYLWGK